MDRLDGCMASDGDTLKETAVQTHKNKYSFFVKKFLVFLFPPPPLYMLPCRVDHSVTLFGKYTL